MNRKIVVFTIIFLLLGLALLAVWKFNLSSRGVSPTALATFIGHKGRLGIKPRPPSFPYPCFVLKRRGVILNNG